MADGAQPRGRRGDDQAHDTVLDIVVTPCVRRPGMFDARLGGNGRPLARSRTPFFDAARVLLGDGADPAAWLTMTHAGADAVCLRARVGAAAKLTVEESAHGPVARSWRPASPSAVEASPMRSRERGATTPAEAIPPSHPGE